MVSFPEIQDLARDTIKNLASGYFTDDLVESDVGLSKDVIESSLTTRGVAYVVDMPVAGSVQERTTGVSLVSVTLPVIIHLNPKQNAADGGAGVNVYEALENIFGALLNYVSVSDGLNDDADRFEPEDECFSLSVGDGGLITYVCFFRKLCALSDG